MLKRMLMLLVATVAFPVLAAPSLIVNCGLTVEAEAPVGELQAYDIALLGGTELDGVKATVRVGKERLELTTKSGEWYKPTLEKYSDKAVSVTYKDKDGKPVSLLVKKDGSALGSIARITYFNDSPVESSDRVGSVVVELEGGEITRLTFGKCEYKGGSAQDWKASFKP